MPHHIILDEFHHLIVIGPYIGIHHLLGKLSFQIYIMIKKIESHIRIVHMHIKTIMVEAIIVVPRPCDINQLINAVLEHTCGIAVILKHLPNLIISKAHHRIKILFKRDIPSDIVTRSNIAEAKWSDARDKDTGHRRVASCGAGFQIVEEKTELANAVSKFQIVVFALGKQCIGKIIVLVNNDIHFLSRLPSSFLYIIRQLDVLICLKSS